MLDACSLRVNALMSWCFLGATEVLMVQSPLRWTKVSLFGLLLVDLSGSLSQDPRGWVLICSKGLMS